MRHGRLAFPLAAAFVAAGWLLLPRAFDARGWLTAQDDPSALTARGLSESFTPDRLRAELEGALDADDVDLAGSFVSLAEARGLAVPAALRERYEAATSSTAEARRMATDFYEGAIRGHGTSGAGLAGTVAADLSGVGDVRDLIREGRRAAGGEEPDRLVVGLAAVGLAISGATIASIGAALPARGGISTLKAAAKGGRLAKPLAADLGRLVHAAVDTQAAKTAVKSLAGLDLAAARTAARATVRPASLGALRGIATDVTLIGRRAGVRATSEALGLARDASELRRVARLAESHGTATRAVLRVLGRGAIVLASGVLALAGWVAAAAAYVWLALLLLVAITRRVARLALWGARSGARATSRLGARSPAALRAV
ncbi:hypothetical protein [Chelatococcus reniformis]|uniref:Uncharacterized protein n=1 Tax=Chelatococcus reniformis TaxID=1494448 RepID=A0A916U7D6_9HYPH|nr:hypothetical protein [Chelatococcus reniformis]GGC61877.1 hypothetical protein GCM10010994_20630 [Chelatococcus reniformis]